MGYALMGYAFLTLALLTFLWKLKKAESPCFCTISPSATPMRQGRASLVHTVNISWKSHIRFAVCELQEWFPKQLDSEGGWRVQPGLCRAMALWGCTQLAAPVHCRSRKAALSERLTLPYMTFTRRFPSDFFKAINFFSKTTSCFSVFIVK